MAGVAVKRNLFKALVQMLLAIWSTFAFADEWIPVPSQIGRSVPSATVLADGRVLVAGGTHFSYLSSAEIFDPDTDSWTLVAPMHVARTGHAAVLLPSGDVMVIGGYTGIDIPTASVEVYNAGNNTWTEIAPLPGPRVGHTATVLSDGSVFVAGGAPASDQPATGTTERLFTLGGAWTVGPALNKPRSNHTATTLSDGRVAYIGGRVQFASEVAEVEILSSDGAHFTLGPSMPIPRNGHISLYDADSNSVLVLSGFASPSGGVGSIVSYSVTNGSWSTVGQLISPKYGVCSSRLPGNRVLIAGGYEGGQRTDNAEVFEPWTHRTWPVQKPMSVDRAGQKCLSIASRGVLVVGSVQNDDPMGDFGADLFVGDGTAIFVDGFDL